MTKGVRITKKCEKPTEGELKEYLAPKKIYIPLVIHCDDNITVLVKKGDYVYKGDMVAKSKGNFRTPIHASISGTVLDYEEKYYLNGKKVKCIVIENDFKEAVREAKISKICGISKEEFVNKIKENGIIGLSGSGFPTYIKYENDLKKIIVNATESNPGTAADFKLVEKHIEEILEIIDAVVDVWNMKEGIIAIKKGNNELKKIINSYIGTYVKLKLVEVPNYYISGWEKYLVKKICKVNCKTYPTANGIVVSNIATMFAMYEAIKYNKPLIERVVTFTGPMLKNQTNVKVKIGTPVSEIIEFIGGYKKGDKTLISNGPMMGTAVESDELVISSDLTSVMVMEAQEKRTSSTCVRCGECILVCPANISPVLIHETKDNKKYHPEKCIDCGLCSYVCPASINLRSSVRKAKEATR